MRLDQTECTSPGFSVGVGDLGIRTIWKPWNRQTLEEEETKGITECRCSTGCSKAVTCRNWEVRARLQAVQLVSSLLTRLQREALWPLVPLTSKYIDCTLTNNGRQLQPGVQTLDDNDIRKQSNIPSRTLIYRATTGASTGRRKDTARKVTRETVRLR